MMYNKCIKLRFNKTLLLQSYEYNPINHIHFYPSLRLKPR